MKKSLLVIACMLAVGQNVRAQESASDFARLYVGAVEAQYPKSSWHDIPYYKGNTNFYPGRVSYHGVVYDDVKLRFDLLKQCVVALPPGERAFCLPEQKFIDWFEMDGHRYVHDPEDSLRYAALLSDGSSNGIRLYHSVWNTIGAERTFGGKRYLKTVDTDEHYMLLTPSGDMYHVKRASDVAKLFPEQKKQIKQFARKNHLSFSRNERENSLTQLVESIRGERPSSISGERLDSPLEPAAETIISPLTSIDDSTLITGIPVLDVDTVSFIAGSSKTKVYIVPGVEKAKASVADDQELAEIVVVGGRQSAVNNMMIGAEKFKPQILKNIPSAFGESDIMKIVLTLPGVTTVGEASSGYNVRGGASDQNLILLNGGTVYNPSHLFGLFTSFNSDAVEDVELFKSSIPVEYGGRISSVLKVTSKEANMQKFTGSASIGALTSKANIEIPIVKDHLSLLLNGRTT